MAAHAYLKDEFTEDKKCQNLMSWLNSLNTNILLYGEEGKTDAENLNLFFFFFFFFLACLGAWTQYKVILGPS